MIELTLTKPELNSGELSSETLSSAVAAMREDGLVVLHNAIDPTHIAALRERMLKEAWAILARPDVPFQFTLGHIQHDPPPETALLFEDVLTNPFAGQISAALMGKLPRLTFYSGNTNMPGSGDQPLHVDSGQLWPNMQMAPPPYGIVVNIPVVDMSAANGSTEIWPGTHHDTRMDVDAGTLRIPEEWQAVRKQTKPPVQPTVPSGSLLMRDLRLWHRGVPNRSSEPRPMIAIIHWAPWWKTEECIALPSEAREMAERGNVRVMANYVEGPIDHLGRHEAYDFRG